jgi:ABC-2 type transport system permease protein
MKYARLYWEFFKIEIQTHLEHRAAFFGVRLAQMSAFCAEFIVIWVVIDKFKAIGAWSAYEVLFLYSLNLFSYAIAGSFFYQPCAYLSQGIRTGEFDLVLTKPLNSFAFLVFRRIDTGHIGHIVVACVVMVICIVRLQISMSVSGILFLCVTLLSGALIQGAAFVITTVPAFWIVRSEAIQGIFFWNLKDFIRYPISIYHVSIQVVLTLIIPYAFVSFYPAQYFLSKNDFLIFHPVFRFLAPIVGALMFAGAIAFWNLGVKHYESTGS